MSYGYYTTSIRVSTGRLCLHDEFSPGDEEEDLDVSCPDLFPWDITVAPSTRDIVEQQLFSRMDIPDIHTLLAPFNLFRFDVRTPFYGRAPLAQLVTVDGDLLDFQLQFSPREIEALAVDIAPWAPELPTGPPRTAFTRMSSGWTRYVVSSFQTAAHISQNSTARHENGFRLSQRDPNQDVLG